MSSTLSIAERERMLRMARAAHLERSAPTSSTIERVDRETPVPLSFAQQRLWFLEHMGGLGNVFHIRQRRRLRGELDRAALVRALDRIVARHEALRTAFPHVDGVPEQRITPAEASRFLLVEHDLREHAQAASELERLIADEVAAPFDLTLGPLIRGRLIQHADDDHVLLITVHHIVADGWSMGVFSRELSTLYAAFHGGGPDPLPPLAVQYADYGAWQRRRLSGEWLQAQAAFWRQALSGAPELLTLPLDHDRPAQMDHAGAQVHVALDQGLTAGLKALAGRHGATLYMTLLAGLSVVLSRLAGQADVVIGTPAAGRSHRDIEGLIGFFVNTLAVRVDVSGTPTVSALLGRVMQQVLDAQHHQDMPFEQVVEVVAPARHLAHHPIFQVLFVWQNAPPGGGGLSLPGLTVGGMTTRAAHVRTECDLVIELAELDGRIVGNIKYATSLFEQATAERYIGYLRRVLEGMTAGDGQRVERLALLAADERSREIEEWNRTDAVYPQDACLHGLLEGVAERTPDATAVIFEDELLTYAELNRRANRLAHHLRSLNVRPESRVAICLERSADMVIALLAVLKAGGAYVPLDPSYPVERLAYMLADSAPSVVLTQSAVASGLPAAFAGLREGVPLVEVDATAPPWATAPATNPRDAVASSAHPAYVIYTSGSTGRPKGVVVPHQGLCNVAVAQLREFHLGPGDCVLQFASFSFDAAAAELIMALASGAALCVAPRDALLPGPQLLTLLRRHAITMVTLPPSALAVLPVEDLPALRTLGVAGEPLPAELVARWGARHRLLNLYGPTEATIWGTWAECTNPAAQPDIGVPIANARAYVLDAEGEPVPVGVAGELHLGGVGVARGYLNRPGLTADRFVPDPFSSQPGARLYRTGDGVARRPDGRLDFLGRVDQQVKVRGFRIELGEIEARLAEHSAVRAAVVIARDDTPGEARLVAYVVADAAAGADVLRAHLSEMLPEYMIPAAYVRLEALPLTPNGKLDRQALPAPQGDAYPTPEYEAPVGETEQALARIWSELLGVPRVGRWDHFFELGGHSLMVLTLSDRMRQHGLHADVRTVFSAPMLASLAAAVSGKGSEIQVPPNRIPKASAVITPEMLPLVTLSQAEIDAVVATVPGGASNVQDIYPLAPLQEGFLFHHLLGAEGDPYLKATFFHFAGRDRLDALVQTLGAVIARHDVLRTAIAWEGLSEPAQVVWRAAPLTVEEVAVSPTEPDVTAALFQRFDPRRHRIDIRRAPLMRAYIARDEVQDQWTLLLLHHHLVVDHATLEVLQSEIAAHLSGRAASLPDPLPFRNYVAQTRLGVSQAEHRAFFEELLGDVDQPTAPFGLLDVRRDGSGMDVAWLMVGEPLAGRLRERARALGVSAASLFHVVAAQVLARTSGRDDVVFGTVLFGRMHSGEGVARMMGLFVNTLPIRIRVGSVGAEASVRETHAQLARLLRHEHAPLALAQRCSGVPAPTPLFTSVLNYRHSPVRQRAIPAVAGMSTGHRKPTLGGERSNYPFDIAVDDLGAAGFRLEAQVAGGVEAQRICAFMYSSAEGLVQALVSAPEQPLRQLPVLPAAEQRLVVEEWNNTETDFPRDVRLHSLFEAQTGRTPDAVAVQSDDETLTYAELNARANQLAHHLIELGVSPDTRVAISTERSPAAVAALLAVLKAGGAYVPLDPGLPVERVRSMLRDSAPMVVLAQAHLAARLASVVAAGVPVLQLDVDTAARARQPVSNPQCATLRPEHLAYVIYTSGSTGTPKGVMVEHRSVCNHMLAIERVFGLTVGDRVLQFAPVAFDIAVEEIFGALMSGATLVLRNDDWLAGAGAFLERCERNCVTVMDLPTRFWTLLLDEAAMPSCPRLVVIGGEAVELDALNAWFDHPADRPRLFVACGPTETTIDATIQEVSSPSDGWGAIGRPIANTQAYVLDGGMELVPVGVTGEIYIGGVQVTRGYLGSASMTAERYVPDPFGGAGGRLYRSGDLGQWRSDGTLRFGGRVDFQVKVRGFRVELGEIEARLRGHPGVREAVVVARDDGAGDKRLVAYLVADDTARDEAIRAHLDQALPEYMVPTVYVRLDELPLTPTGKLDRAALPAPDDKSDDTGVDETPIGETEHALAEIWSEVLNVDRVSRHDNFFELGGHSLLAVQVISRVQRRLMVDVGLGELFSRPVLRDFAQTLETAPRAELPPIEPVSREGQLPLSFAQQRLWFLEQLQDLGSTYHVPWRHRLQGSLDHAALKRALDRIVARHEALRTTFVQVDGVSQQRVASLEASGFFLLEHDLTDRPDALAELKRLVGAEFHEPFDLERGPLIRGRLVKLAEDNHVLLVTLHHIISDGWSIAVIAHEMNALYDAFCRDEPDPLPALAVQYADYAAWQRQWVDGDLLQRQADYWVETLAGLPELLQVPTDHARPARMDHVGAQLRVQLDPELTTALKALGRIHGTTLFMTLLAGWAIVLGRLSRQSDLVVGTVSANRGRPEIEPLVGFFVNTIVLRLDLSGSITVAELLGRVKRTAIDAQHHQDIPFEKVVELVDPVRSMSHTPLFQAMFAWQSEMQRDDELSLEGVRQGSMGSGSSQAPAKFDLSLSLRESGDRITGSVVYATALFERETVTRHIGYLQRVLEQMAADDRQPVQRLPLLPDSERDWLVREGNGPQAHYPRLFCVHDLIEAQVGRTPGAEAVVFEETRLTYAELNARANRLAHHLIALGVGPDVRVGICVQRSLDMVVGMLAVLKAGGGYVPLDPSYPPDHLAYMLKDSAPAAILTHTHLRDRVQHARVPVLELDATSPEWVSRPSTNPVRQDVAAEHLAYMTYTSGSTGRPKGVANPHRASVNRFSWMQERHALRVGEGVLQNSAFSFDASVFEIFWPLTVGGRVIVPRSGAHRDPEYLVQLIIGERVGTAYFVCSMLQLFLEYPDVERCTELTRLFCGGEALSSTLVDRVRARLPHVRLHNLYGPTESAVSVSGEVLVFDDAVSSAPIGRPVPNVRVYLLDEWGEPVPTGVAGELHVAGAQLARGYHNRPELTAERFVADPYCGEPGARMYRTGDRARWRPDGTIDFIGRVDFQVKMRGYRIEPAEIEARLVEHASVRETLVLLREDTPGDVRLVAYWTGEDVEAERLRAHLSKMLPSYMVPSAYMRLEQLPLTPSGKLNRGALPAPVGPSTRSYEPPEGETEPALARIWAEVLHVDRVGRHDDFFALGGHSLLAVQVIARVREVLKVEATLSTLFTWPVLKDSAQQLRTAAPATVPPIEIAPRTDRLPLSFAQRRLWFLEQLGGLGSTYHLRRRLTFRGEFDRTVLAGALDAMVARHESLRTTFTHTDGVAEQRIAPADVGFRLVEHDLSEKADAEGELKRLAAEEARALFDLFQGPLVRGRLIRMAADRHVLLITVHHIISDGWSMGVFTRELRALYGAFRAGRQNPLPALPVQYADYAAWQQGWVGAQVIEQQTNYWEETLAGAPELLELPTDRPRPPRMDHAGDAFGVELDETLTVALKGLARRHGTTLFMTILAGWATVLSRLSGQDDVVIGTPAAGRGRREIEGLIGFFVNTLALRLDLSGAPTVAELLVRVKARTLRAQEHQDLPFEQVVEVVAPVRSLAHSPVFQAMFVWVDTSWTGSGRSSLARVEEGREPGDVTESPDGQAQLELTLALSESAGRIVGAVEYATSLFDRSTVERYVGYLRHVLAAMVADDQQRIDELPLLTNGERGHVLAQGQARGVGAPCGGCVPELFEAQAARTPEAIAVVSATESLTYAELNRRANQVAHGLRALGVGPDVRVGLCVARGPEMMVGVLGVLKAGGAYVPLDPAYPAARLAYMLADAAPAAVLTQAHLHDRVVAQTRVPVWALDDRSLWGDGPATTPPRGALMPDHLAYVIYTSGSTGQPKATAVPHAGVVNLLEWYRTAFELDERDRVLVVSSFSFDLTQKNLLAPLAAGGQVHLAAEPFDPAALVGQIAQQGITRLNLTPSACYALVDADPGEALRSLRTVVLGGEPIRVTRMRPLASYRGLTVVNSYGPTECSDVSVCYRLGTDWTAYAEVVPTGRPIGHTRLYVLDARGEPVPVGVTGEVYIAGRGVGRGYLGQPALTAERFVPEPFSGAASARMYRTGDLGRWRGDGTLEYRGRADFQVKVRGVRIELGEIEARLLAHPGVREAAVVVRTDVPGDPRLVAYIVGDATASAEGLRAHLQETLPEALVPAAYVALLQLPLTPSGKLDRKALPAPGADAHAAREYEAPEGEIEVGLAEIWSELLPLERVGRSDDFFALGGHSLLAVQVVSRVRKVFETELPLTSVFERPMLSALADQILDMQLSRFDPETLAQLAPLVRADDAGTATESEKKD